MFCKDDQVKGEFKENIFYVTFGEAPKLKTIVQKLIEHTNHQVPEFQNGEDAVNQLEHFLKNIGRKGPILLVLDDLWRGSESLVDNFVFPIPNFKILVTSLYELKRLGEEDAKTLLHHSASLNQSRTDISDDDVNKMKRSLQKLNITNCHDLSALPKGIGNLVNLESVRLSSCTGLKELPDSIRGLRNLKFLDISDCISLSNLPENIGELLKLENLNVRGCSRLSELPSSIMHLLSLRNVLCDEETAVLWEPFKTIHNDLRLEQAPADFNLDFLHSLQSRY